MNIVERLISIVAPHECIACGYEGSLLCTNCIELLGPLPPEKCFSCQKISSNNKTCKNCRQKSKLGHVWIRTEYKDEAKELIHLLKFERAKASQEIIAAAMVEILPKRTSTIIVPIPTASSRKRQRGYDQSVLIAKRISTITSLPLERFISRIGQSRQVGSLKTERLLQLRDAFLVNKPEQIKGAHIILIDDVMTTGATLEAAATVLRNAGAKQVDALVFARA